MTKALKINPIQIEAKSPQLELVQGGEATYDAQFESEFKLKSEYFEKNVSVDQVSLDSQDKDFTQVKIYRENGIDVIDPRSLKDFIAKHKGINQVVIEKISLNEATRVSLLFEPFENGQEQKNLLEEHVLSTPKDEFVTDKKFSLDELETLVNQDFFGRSSSSLQDHSSKNTTGSLLSFSFPENIEEPNKTEISNTDRLQKEQNILRPNLKLKSDSSIKDPKKLNYEKHTLTRKKCKSGNSFYYRAKDHMELYKVGSSFLKDFKSGLKSFSFASCGLETQREKSVLGITSFFNYHEDINICVITKEIVNSFYSAIAEEFSVQPRDVFDELFTYDVHQAGGFDIIELGELKKVERKLRQYDFEYFLNQLLDSYDLLLWDLPAMDVLDANKELYFPIIRSLDNVSFIVGKNKSKVSEINSMVSYFKRYQIQIKGLLFSEENPKGKTK